MGQPRRKTKIEWAKIEKNRKISNNMQNVVSWGTDEGGYIHLSGRGEPTFCLSAHPMHDGAQITTITLEFLTWESFRPIQPIKIPTDWNPRLV